jgi:hypothetical protein
MWRTYYKRGLKQYSKINCDLAVKIMDTLLEDLAKAGLRAKQEIKIELIEKAVIEFNALDSMTGQAFIETEERDELGQLFERVAIKAKIDLEQFEYNDITYKVRTW